MEKSEFELRKKRALDVQSKRRRLSLSLSACARLDRPVGVGVRHGLSSAYDFLSANAHQLEPSMSDAAYFDLFNSDPSCDELNRTVDETQLAINSIVHYGVTEQHEPQIDAAAAAAADSTNFFFDDLDPDNPHQDANQSQDDEASRAVQNLLGFS